MSFLVIICLCLSLSAASFGKEVRIIGGIDADIREFPHIVSLRKIKNNEHFCGGSIITDWHIITAAHCFVDTEEDQIDDFRAYSGTSNSSDTSGPAYRFAYIDLHPKYTPTITSTASHLNDIAIITLRQRIKFNEYQNKVDLPTKESKAGETGYLSGWGYTSYPSLETPEQLQKAKMTIMDHDLCMDIVSFAVNQEQLCAFQRTGVGSCIGDSGGPLTVNGKLVGISSFNLPCARGVPDIYTDVYNYMEFILPIIKM